MGRIDNRKYNLIEQKEKHELLILSIINQPGPLMIKAGLRFASRT